MSDERSIPHIAMKRAFDALGASCEATVWAVIAAYPEHALSPPDVTERTRDPVGAAYRVAQIADQLKDALVHYRVVTGLLPAPEPPQWPPDDFEDDLPF